VADLQYMARGQWMNRIVNRMTRHALFTITHMNKLYKLMIIIMALSR